MDEHQREQQEVAGAEPGPEDENLRQVDLDWDELAMALENQLPDLHGYLHLETGRVITVASSQDLPPEFVPGETCLFVEPRPSREGYRTMQRFVATVENETLRRRLSEALVGRGAFRRFKDCLLEYPGERQRWFAFKDNEVFAYARRWLAGHGLRPAGDPPRRNGERPARPVLNLATRPAPAAGDFRRWIAPFDRPALLFRPERAALLVIDMQRIFADPQGSSYLPAAGAAAENLQGVIAACRETGVPVLFTRHRHRYPERDGGSMGRWWRSLIIDGSRDSELMPGFEPAAGEPLIEKSRYDAFHGTELESLLRSSGVEDLIIGGVMTNLCCETTAREAFVRDFNVFFLADGTATADEEMQRASLCNIAYGFGRVLGCDEVVRQLRRRAAHRPA